MGKDGGTAAGRAAGWPVDVGALLVAGSHAAFGDDRLALPDLAHRGVQQGECPGAHLRDAGQGDAEGVGDVGERLVPEEVALHHLVESVR
jgi:hypothetical protein